MVQVVGIDAYKWGWVAVALEDGGFAEATADTDLARMVDRYPEAAAVAVDIPIGFPDNGWRRADDGARALLGRRWMTVFRIPPRPVWESDTYDDATNRCRQLTGSGLSRQAFGLREKLLEANRLVDDGKELHEVHPEVCFHAMGASAQLPSKKSWAGQTNRRRLLESQGISLPDDLGPAGVVPPDDVLDAAAAAWSAHRIARRGHVTVPADLVTGEPRISY